MTPRNMNLDWTSEFVNKVDKVPGMDPESCERTLWLCPAGQAPDRTGFR
jgi:hypothetical protein